MYRRKRKSKKWKFKGYLPEIEDVSAEVDSYKAMQKLLNNNPVNDFNYYTGGFYRGLRWAIDKYGIDAKHLPEYMK